MPDLSWIAARVRELRTHPTDAERRLWRALRHRQFAGHKFRRQAPIGTYIVDFVCFDARLVIEVDGAQHLDQQRDYDAARDVWLREQGFRVLRFWNSQVLNALDEVEAAIWQALEGAPAPRPLPHEGGGGESDAARVPQGSDPLSPCGGGPGWGS